MYEYSEVENRCFPCEDKIEECGNKEMCSHEGVKPAILNKAYPEIKVIRQNKYYADLLSEDFAGQISELTAVNQYINHEIRLTSIYCEASRLLLSISMAEMKHLQIIGELIVLLGGESCGGLKYSSCTKLCEKTWKPDYIDYEISIRDMIIADLNGECRAIKQYSAHVKEIKDSYIKANLQRIIEDEKYHICLLKNLLIALENGCKK